MVFKAYNSLGQFIRKCVGGRKTPLPIGGNAGTNEFASSIFEQEGIWRIKKRLGQAKEPNHKKNKGRPAYGFTALAPPLVTLQYKARAYKP